MGAEFRPKEIHILPSPVCHNLSVTDLGGTLFPCFKEHVMVFEKTFQASTYRDT